MAAHEGVEDERARGDGVEGAGVLDGEDEAVEDLPCVGAAGRAVAEGADAEAAGGEDLADVLQEAHGVKPRGAEDAEREGAVPVAVQGRVGFGEDGGGVERRAVPVADRGGGRREVRPRLPPGVRPVPHADDGEVDGQFPLAHDVGGAFAGRHAVAEGDVERGDEGGEARLAPGAVDDAAERNRAVEDGDGQMGGGGGFEHVLQRREVGVAPHADVLEVDDDAREALEHLGAGTPRGAVERMDGDVPEGMRLAGGLLAGGGEAKPAVFRGEEAFQAVAERAAQTGRRGGGLLREEAKRGGGGGGEVLDERGVVDHRVSSFQARRAARRRHGRCWQSRGRRGDWRSRGRPRPWRAATRPRRPP